MSRQGKLPLRLLNGSPIKPYEVNLKEFEKLESIKVIEPASQSSLKIKKVTSSIGHKRKEILWQK